MTTIPSTKPRSSSPAPADEPSEGAYPHSSSGPAGANQVHRFEGAPLEQARRELRTDWSRLDFVVTEKEAERAVSALGELSAEGVADALTSLSASGELKSLVDALDGPGVHSFLSMLANKGIITMVSPEGGSGALSPPTSPEMFEMDRRLPPELNEAIDEDAKRGAFAYFGEYRGYLNRYVDAVAGCATGAELRALGPRAPLEHFMPSFDVGDPMFAQYHRGWTEVVAAMPSGVAAERALSNKVSQFLGERPPGFSLEAAFKGALGGRAYKGEGRLDNQGPRQALHTGTTVDVEVPGGKYRGTRWDTGAADVRAEAGGWAAEMNVDGSVGAPWKVSHSGLGAIGAKEGQAELELRAIGPLWSYSYGAGEAGQFGGGVKAKVGDDLELRVGVGFQGVSAAQAFQALSTRREGLFDTPTELLAGVPFAELPPEAREFHRRHAWTEEEWETARAKQGRR